MRASKSRRGLSVLVRPALWFCACNLLAAALAAQCTNVSQVPDQTISSGTSCYSNNDMLTAAGVTINGSASVTFVAGHTVHLMPGFRATAGTAGTTFHVWVETAPSTISVFPSSGSGLSQQFTWTGSSPSGYGNLADVFALFNTSISGANACYIHYNPASNLLYLADNTGANWLGGFVPGTSSSASNSYCMIYGTGSLVSASGNQLSLTVNVAFQTSTFSGTQNSYLNVIDSEGLYTGFQQMGTWTVAGGTGFTPIRISAGGPYTDSLGQYWAADYGYLQSLGTWSTTAAISGTSDQRLYQTERYNYPGSLTYQFGVPNGNYTVTLKFAEIYDTAAGQRYQNIALNGTTVVAGLDVWTAAGGPNRAYDLSFPVNATNGQLTISLTCTSPNNSAEVNAIQIVAAGTPQQYSLTTGVTPSGAGSVTPSCPSGCSYTSGSQVQITATPAAGYQFGSFTGVDSSNGSTGYVTMNANRSVTTNFTASPPNITGISPTSGTVGTPVTITGTGFGTSGTVSFNGTPAQQIDSWSPTTVIARVPAGATSGLINLSTGGYQTSYQAQQFQVTSIGVTVSPTTATLGQGESTQFSATVTGMSNQQVTWSISPTTGSISSTGLYTAPATIAALQTVTVTATSAAQQTATGTATVTLVPPTPTITYLSLPSGPPQVGFVVYGANFGPSPTQACDISNPHGCVILTGLPGGNIPLTVINNSWTAGSITVQIPANTPAPPAGQVYAGQIYVVTTAGSASNQAPFTVSATFGCNF
jgi:hypothetical protein